MANKSWKDMGIKIWGATNTGAMVDISAYVNSQTLASAITDLDQTGMGATSHNRQNGLGNPTITLNGWVNSTTEAIFGPLQNGTSVAKKTEFKSYSARFYNGYFLPSNVQISGTPNTLQTWSATLNINGALNRTSVGLT